MMWWIISGIVLSVLASAAWCGSRSIDVDEIVKEEHRSADDGPR